MEAARVEIERLRATSTEQAARCTCEGGASYTGARPTDGRVFFPRARDIHQIFRCAYRSVGNTRSDMFTRAYGKEIR